MDDMSGLTGEKQPSRACSGVTGSEGKPDPKIQRAKSRQSQQEAGPADPGQ